MISGKSKTASWIFSTFFTILLLGVPKLTSYAQDFTYEINTIPLKGELVNLFGRCFLQDNDGFIWFGSEDGLYRYNGSSYTIFRNIPDDPTSISNNQVHALIEDSEGIIWVGTYSGLNRFDKYTETFQRYLHEKGNPVSIKNHRIDQIVEDKEGYLWIATYTGFSKFNRQTESFNNYSIPRKESSPNREEYRIFSLYPDGYGYLWLLAETRLYRMDIETESIEYIEDGWKKPRFEDRSGRLWFAGGGLYSYDRKNHRFERYLYEPDNPNRLQTQGILAMLEDKSRNFWLRTNDGIYCYNQDLDLIFYRKHNFVYPNTADYNFAYALMQDNTGTIWYYTRDGINQIIKKDRNFRVYDPDPAQQNFVNCLYVENKNLIWLGTLRGIFSFDRRNNTFTQHYGESFDGPGHAHSARTMYMDKEGMLWVGMDYEGLFCMVKPGDSMMQFSKNLPATPDIKSQDKMDLYKIKYIFEDSHGRLWIGVITSGPLYYYDREEDLLIQLLDNPEAQDKLPREAQIRHETGTGVLWTIGKTGVFKILPPFNRITRNSIMPSEVIKCQAIDNNGILQSIPQIRTSYIDSMGAIWLGTYNNGLIKLMEDSIPVMDGAIMKIKSFTTTQGSPSNSIKSIVEDGKGNLWVGTDRGLSKFNLLSETFTNYFVRHGLPTNNFQPESAFKNKDGELFFGTREGLISFFPDSIQINQEIAPVMITDFKINNQAVYPGDNSTLQKSITYTDKIELKHNQDNLSFEFAILNYLDTELNQYRYKLEGFKDDWIYTGNRTSVDFTNLSPGHYTLLVSGANNDGIWNEAGASLQIIIHPPPWRTWWAYTVYGFILLGIILLYRRYLLNRAKLRTAVEIERMEKEKVEEIDHMRSRFFANISHEFRTPLTLLLGPIEDLKKNLPELSSKNQGLLQTMKRNGQRLQHLVNQLLDISKLETGKVKLQVSEGDLTEFISRIVLSFLSLAESNNIRYEYDLPELPDLVYFDPDKLEKIFINLVSNAFKFTPNGGSIRITLRYISTKESDAPSFAEISVRDTGKGIPAEKLGKIFDRFYQVSDSDTRDQEGTGIGLALTNELVDLYKGEIHVESEPGTGSIFTVKIPVSKEFFKEDEILKLPSGEEKKPAEPMVDSAELKKTDFPKAHTGGIDKAEPVVLIVEDNTDLRNYISQNLVNEYPCPGGRKWQGRIRQSHRKYTGSGDYRSNDAGNGRNGDVPAYLKTTRERIIFRSSCSLPKPTGKANWRV